MSTPSVLVVDDDQPLADLYAAWLAEEYEVYTAYGGEEALECVDELGDALDAILLDRRMPDLTGDLLLVLLRDRGFDCPVSMVTAVEPSVDILTLGFDDYLMKPVTESELLETVESLLSIGSLDSVVRELSMLRVKRNVLSLELPPSKRAADTEFATLGRRIESLEHKLTPHGVTSRGSAD